MKKLLACLLLLPVLNSFSQEMVEPIKFGDMERWLVREVKESGVIGGNTRYIYSLDEGDTLRNNTPYKSETSQWGTSSVLAKVKGVTKASITVFPEKRETGGTCARLETRLEKCKVLGLFNINVLASGTIFLGQMQEPITSTDNPQSKLITGIPFTKRPKALQYDYKVVTGGNCIRSTGFSGQKKLDRIDMAEVHLLLQYRWEDENGNVYAKRVGTAWERLSETVESWQNKHRAKILYGDITETPGYDSYMGLLNGDRAYYTENSKGKMVPIQETEWGDSNDKVTHLVLQFSSSNGGAYVGSVTSRLWVDNIGLVY